MSLTSYKGFTLIELMVSVAIMVLIIATVVLGSSGYNDSIGLSANTSNMYLALRQAQVFGTSVKELTPGSNQFAIPYGVSFNITGSGSNTSFVTFADLNSNGQYDGTWACPTGGECLAANPVSYNDTISQMCWLKQNGQSNCNVGRADITFVRPYSDAHVTIYDSGGSPIVTSNFAGIQIVISSPKGAKKTVSVYSSGQIGVQ